MNPWKQRKNVMYEDGEDVLKVLAKIRDIDDLGNFLNPDESNLNDPYQLLNIDSLVFKILDAVQNEKKISVYFDADFDGCSSGAIMYNFLSNFTDKIKWFMTDKIKAHGIKEGMHCIPEGTEVLILIDSSSNDSEICKELSEKGIEVLIIDHHEISEENTYATIVNPQLSGDTYPNKSISASALTWQVVRVMDDTLGTDFHNEFIDLAGMGLISDVMNLSIPENRYIVNTALDRINNIGLLAILKKNMKDPHWDTINTTDIGFGVSPVINGCIRLGEAEKAAKLLVSKDENEVKQLVKEMFKLNNERKKMQKEMTESILPQVDKNDKILLVIDEEGQIDGGFRGLIAGELASMFMRPVMIVSPRKGLLQGSCRSYGGFKFKSFLDNTPKGYVSYAMGHEGAFGVGLYTKNIDKLKKYMNDNIREDMFKQTIFYDIEIAEDMINDELIEDILKFNRITGEGFPSVTVRINNIFVGEAELIGKASNTVKAKTSKLDLMKFRVNEQYFSDFPMFENVDVVGNFSINKFYHGGYKRFIYTNQLMLEDVKISN